MTFPKLGFKKPEPAAVVAFLTAVVSFLVIVSTITPVVAAGIVAVVTAGAGLFVRSQVTPVKG